MHYVIALALSVLLPLSAFAYSPKQPERHHRYSANHQFFLDFNPETHRHTVYAAEFPDDPIWSIESDAFWPFKRDESDGCLFISDDGLAVAGPTWVHWTGQPPDYRVFDGLEFWGPEGQTHAYRVSELPSWRLPILDFPVRILWIAIHGPEGRGRNLSRRGDELHARTFGMRSFTFSLKTGELTGWNLNANYFVYLAIVYALPVCLLARWIFRRRRVAASLATDQPTSRWSVLAINAGSLLVVLNSLGFALGVFLDSFGGTIDQIGAQFCRLTFPLAFVLIPITLVHSAVGLAARPRRLDVLGPWLAIMSAAVLAAISNPY